MSEFSSLNRCAAYLAAQAALDACQTVAGSWPIALAAQAERAAAATIERTANAVAHGHGSPDRRRCLRDALASAIRVAAIADHIGALGFGNVGVEHLQRTAGRSVAMLAMFLHASSSVQPR